MKRNDMLDARHYGGGNLGRAWRLADKGSARVDVEEDGPCQANCAKHVGKDIHRIPPRVWARLVPTVIPDYWSRQANDRSLVAGAAQISVAHRIGNDRRQPWIRFSRESHSPTSCCRAFRSVLPRTIATTGSSLRT